MFIQTEPTPNPATLKFLPGVEVMETGTMDFGDSAAAQRSPLAQRLFEIEYVERVFFGSDFISVTQVGGEWSQLKAAILAVIMEHFTAGVALFNASDEAAAPDAEPAAQDADGPDSEVILQIKELLDTRVRPAVAQDGGDIIFERYEDGIVYLQMQGACAGCPSSTATLQYGIENMLKHYIPEVVAVRPVGGVDLF